MEDRTFMWPAIGCKYFLRSTGEEVEVIDFEAKERGDRTDEDWVTYIDSEGNEHIKEHLNIQLDFKAQTSDVCSKMLEMTSLNKMPSEKNRRTFEVAKELMLRHYNIDTAIQKAKQLVEEVGEE